jgi:hypothetical protein
MKRNLSSDDQQFHKYQQNKQSPLILTELTKHKKDHKCDVGIPCPGLGQAQHAAGLNRLMGSQPSPVDNWILNGNT